VSEYAAFIWDARAKVTPWLAGDSSSEGRSFWMLRDGAGQFVRAPFFGLFRWAARQDQHI
jgi:hypothetical protein